MLLHLGLFSRDVDDSTTNSLLFLDRTVEIFELLSLKLLFELILNDLILSLQSVYSGGGRQVEKIKLVYVLQNCDLDLSIFVVTTGNFGYTIVVCCSKLTALLSLRIRGSHWLNVGFIWLQLSSLGNRGASLVLFLLFLLDSVLDNFSLGYQGSKYVEVVRHHFGLSWTGD